MCVQYSGISAACNHPMGTPISCRRQTFETWQLLSIHDRAYAARCRRVYLWRCMRRMQRHTRCCLTDRAVQLRRRVVLMAGWLAAARRDARGRRLVAACRAARGRALCMDVFGAWRLLGVGRRVRLQADGASALQVGGGCGKT